MATLGLQKGEGAGLAVAVALHAGLLALLVLRPATREIIPPPQRIEVSISDEVGLTSTSPDPFSPAAPEQAPTLGEPAPEAPSEAEADPQPESAPEPAPAPAAKPEPRPEPRPVPSPARSARPRPEPSRSAPRPVARPNPQPSARASTSRRSSAIDSIVSSRSSPRSNATSASRATSRRATSTPRNAGGSRVDSNFLDGMTGASAQSGSGTPAAAIGPATRSALSAAITRQLKPHWSPPSGVDVDRLVTVLSFNLNRDGSLSGTPRVVRQTGITDSNRAQAARHAEQAIRAVQLAAPFNLPSEYYDAWKRVSSFEFDLRLSQ